MLGIFLEIPRYGYDKILLEKRYHSFRFVDFKKESSTLNKFQRFRATLCNEFESCTQVGYKQLKNFPDFDWNKNAT